MTQPNPSREVELQRTLIDHVPQLEEEIEEVFSQLDEARAEVEDLSHKNSSFVDEIVTLKAEVERVRKTWAANWQEQKDQVEELKSYAAQVVHEWRQHPNLIMYSTFEIRMNSAVNVLAKAALAKGDSSGR